MATNFGKGNRAIAFNPTSAFPLDARTYFESYDEALAKAQTAEEVGSTNTQYHYGMKLLVKDGNTFTWYKIVKGSPYLEEEGSGGSSNGMSIPVITTTLTGSSTVSDLRDLLRANGITKDDVCIIYKPSSFTIMVKIDDFDSSSTYISVPIWFDLNNPLGAKGIIANNASTTISELFQRYEAGLNTTNTQLRSIINELYNKAVEGGSTGSNSLVLPVLQTDLTIDNTLLDLLTTLRDNGISQDDMCFVRSSSISFPDIIVQIADADTETEKAEILTWYSFAYPLGMTSYPALSLSFTIGRIHEFYTGGLSTTNKTFQGAINELSNKTIDKLYTISTYSSSESPAFLSKDSKGILWTDEYTVGTGYTGEFSSRVPIVEGDNVTFEVDEENNVLKINALSSGDTDIILSDGEYIQGQGSNGTLFNVLGVSDDKIQLGASGKTIEVNSPSYFKSTTYLQNGAVLTHNKAIKSALSSGTSVNVAKVNSSNQLEYGSTDCSTYLKGKTGGVYAPNGLIITGDSVSNYLQITGNSSNPGMRLYNGNFVTYKKSNEATINAIYAYDTYANLWGTWKLNSATISTSWKGAKHGIEEIPDRYSVLFDNLRPVRFKYNDGTSGRYHTGLILEELKDAMDTAGVDSSEFASYCILDKETGEGGIRYEELISLAISEVQKLKKKNQELEQRIVELEAKLQP